VLPRVIRQACMQESEPSKIVLDLHLAGLQTSMGYVTRSPLGATRSTEAPVRTR
jgi:hypothetical protein